MKKIRYILLVIMLSLPLCGYTLKGGVKYTVEQARKEAFADVEYRLPQSIIERNLIDPNFKENQRARKYGKVKLLGRGVSFYSDGGYSLVYDSNLYYEYSYNSEGKLESIGKRSQLTCPLKIYNYNTSNQLMSVRLQLSLKESYVFNVNGQLEAHWIGNSCYDKNGQILNQKL